MTQKKKKGQTWSGRTTAPEHQGKFPAKLNPKTKQGFRKVWLLDAQWSTCPVEVEEQVAALWRFLERGNDYYIILTSLHDLEKGYNNAEVDMFNEVSKRNENVPLKTDLIVKYIKEVEPTIGENDQILIHWWW